MASPIRARPTFTHSQSSHQDASQASYPHPSEGRQNENWNHRKLTKLITWITILYNSMKLWAVACRATQDRQVMVESSENTWSTGEENGKPLHSCLKSPMNSMKKQKDMTLKDELPRLVGAQYATGEEQINSSRRNEAEPKWTMISCGYIWYWK